MAGHRCALTVDGACVSPQVDPNFRGAALVPEGQLQRERLPSKWAQIQSKSLLRLRLRVSSLPCAAPKLLQTFTEKILSLSSSWSEAEKATRRALAERLKTAVSKPQ